MKWVRNEFLYRRYILRCLLLGLQKLKEQCGYIWKGALVWRYTDLEQIEKHYAVDLARIDKKYDELYTLLDTEYDKTQQ